MGLVQLQAWEWRPKVTRREENTQPVTHVPAEQVADDCKEAGLEDEGHHSDR